MGRTLYLALAVALVGVGCGDAEEEPPPSPAPAPLNEYCRVVATWNAAWVSLEAEVLALTNDRRAAGANCRTEGSFAPAGALTLNSALRCSARNHSLDMAVYDFFDHTNLQGESPFDRIDKTGYEWNAAGENIAAGYSTAQEVVDGWMLSDGHCANIMAPEFTELGVGYYFENGDRYGHFWTQNFGRPW